MGKSAKNNTNKRPYQVSIKPMFKKNNGQVVLDIREAPFKSSYKWIETVTLTLPPGEVAGNHSHKHAEAFIAFDEGFEFFWQDNSGKLHSMQMYKKNKSQALILPSGIPHAVRNNTNRNLTLVKFANEPPGLMERIVLI